ncbi:hypothetical protein AMR95_14680 [Bacillus sp. G1(2015b)]|nr:hypothetical protein AMR95_14680 [Bacillus sp. G1(2015b)]
MEYSDIFVPLPSLILYNLIENAPKNVSSFLFGAGSIVKLQRKAPERTPEGTLSVFPTQGRLLACFFLNRNPPERLRSVLRDSPPLLLLVFFGFCSRQSKLKRTAPEESGSFVGKGEETSRADSRGQQELKQIKREAA